MRPIILEMQGFGPYATPQVIDFRKFEKNKLFLIHGPTGAGKSSIFDALCFALYGETSDGRNHTASIRSHHLTPQDPTIVRFSFGVGDKTYRVERSFLPKKRSDGLDERHIFYETDPVTLSPISEPVEKKERVREMVEQTLGFKADQFRQIVILPQNKFQEILLSKNDTKVALLKQIFTEANVYERLEQRLIELKKEAAKGIELAEKSVNTLLESQNIKGFEELGEIMASLALEIKTAGESLSTLGLELDLLRKKETEEKNLLNDIASLESVKQKMQVLEAQQTEIQTIKEKLDKAEQALEFQIELNNIQNLEEQSNRVSEENKKHQNDVAAFELRAREIKASFERGKELVEKISDMRSKLASFLPRLEKADDFTQAETRLAEAKSQIKAFQNDAEKLKAKENLMLEDRKRHQEDMEAGKGIDSQIQTLMASEAVFKQLFALDEERKSIADEVVGLEKNLGERKTKHLAKLADFDKTRSHFLDLEQRWWHSQAGHLAAKLESGKPCPVCGSAEHPDLAVLPENTPTEEAFKAGERNFQTQREELGRLAGDLEIAKTKLEGKKKQLSDIKDKINSQVPLDYPKPYLFRESYLKLGNKTEELRKLKTKAEQAQNAIAEIDQQLEQCKKNGQNMLNATHRLDVEVSSLQTKLEEWKNGLPLEANTPDGLRKLCDSFQTEIDRYEKGMKSLEKQREDNETALTAANALFKATEKQIGQIVKNQSTAKDELAQKLKKSPFADEEALRLAFMPETERQKMRSQMTQWQSDRDNLAGQLGMLEKKIGAKNLPDHAATLHLLQTQEEEYQKLTGESAGLLERQRNLKEFEGKISSELNKLHQLKENSKDVVELAKVAAGETNTRISFTNFVLAALLDEVLAFANQRLQNLSNGRYDLIRELSHDKRVKTGLSLFVLDNHTNQIRPVDTLSGGETFYTSLALALGLADAASARAGGRKLETLFIDEGFGSLDASARDSAIDTLMHLVGENRLVGIISHIQDIRERFSNHCIEVVGLAKGSEVRVG